jgi:hypothetical protein
MELGLSEVRGGRRTGSLAAEIDRPKELAAGGSWDRSSRLLDPQPLDLPDEAVRLMLRSRAACALLPPLDEARG